MFFKKNFVYFMSALCFSWDFLKALLYEVGQKSLSQTPLMIKLKNPNESISSQILE